MIAGGAGWLSLSSVFGTSTSPPQASFSGPPPESPATAAGGCVGTSPATAAGGRGDPALADPWEGNEDIAEEDLAEFLSHQLRLKDAVSTPLDPIVAALQKCRARCAAVPSLTTPTRRARKKEFDTSRCLVGDAVMAQYADGQFYPAHVESVDWMFGVATVTWDDGDELHRDVRLEHIKASRAEPHDGLEERPSMASSIGSLSAASTSPGLPGPPSTGSSTSASTARPSIESLGLGHAVAADPVSNLAFTEPFAEHESALEDAWEVEFMLRSALDKKGPFAKQPRRTELLAELSEAAPRPASRSRAPSFDAHDGRVLLGGYL